MLRGPEEAVPLWQRIWGMLPREQKTFGWEQCARLFEITSWPNSALWIPAFAGMTGAWERVRRMGVFTIPLNSWFRQAVRMICNETCAWDKANTSWAGLCTLDSGLRRNDGGLGARSNGFVVVPSLCSRNSYLIVRGLSAHHPADSTCKKSVDYWPSDICLLVGA